MFMLGVDYEPTEKQKRWHRGEPVHGGRGIGKSTYAVMDALRQAVENDGIIVDVVTEHSPEYLVDVFLRRVSPELYKFSKLHRTAILPNGSRIRFLTAQNIDHMTHSVKVEYVMLDEASYSVLEKYGSHPRVGRAG